MDFTSSRRTRAATISIVLNHAREYESKGQTHDAWLYYLEARSLVSPLPFMSTAVTDKLYDESQKALPSDFPADGKTVDLAAGTGTYKLTELFPDIVGNDLDLVVKYKVEYRRYESDLLKQHCRNESIGGEVSGTARCLCRDCGASGRSRRA